MNKLKSYLKAVLVTTVVFSLIGMSSTAVFTNGSVTEMKTSDIPGAVKIANHLKTIEISRNTANLGGNILISSGDGDYTHPQITKDQSNNIVVAMTQELDVLDQRMAWSYSQDDGVSWNGIETTEAQLTAYNDVAVLDKGNFKGLFGVYNDLGEALEGFYMITDVTDLATWTMYTWTSGNEELEYVCISDHAYMDDQYNAMSGPIYAMIEFSDLCDLSHCPVVMVVGIDDEGEILGGSGSHDCQGGPHNTVPFPDVPAADIEMSNDGIKSQFVWQYTKDQNTPTQIVWKMMLPIPGDTDSTDIEYVPYAKYIGEGQHPAVAHNGNNIAIVYMNGGNVVCAYSTDMGTTWQIKTIGQGSYPDICAIGSTFNCAYVNGGNLYTVISEDNGATWSAPEQANDQDGTVVAEENAIDINIAGLVWTDNRDGKKNIYFAGSGAGPMPNIEIEKISGGMGITATIKNSGDAAAENFAWSIKSDGTVFVGKEKSGTISSLAAGASTTVKTGFMLGIGAITITVTADTASKTAEAKILLFFVTGL